MGKLLRFPSTKDGGGDWTGGADPHEVTHAGLYLIGSYLRASLTGEEMNAAGAAFLEEWRKLFLFDPNG